MSKPDILKINDCIQIFSGEISTGGSGTVTEKITNFRMLYVKTGSAATYIPIPVVPNSNSLRGANIYTNSSNLEFFVVVGTKSSDGLTFNLTTIGNWRMTTSGNTNSNGYSTITEIWGVR